MSKVYLKSVVAYLDGMMYTLVENGEGWSVEVPPDLKDGQYDTLIVGTNEIGEQGAWSGVLYMLTGKACLKIISSKRKLTKQDKEILLQAQTNKIELKLVERGYFLNLVSNERKLELLRGCCV